MSKTRPYRTLASLTVAALLTACPALSQTAALDAIRQTISQQDNSALQERMYARTDKNLYMAGEIAWFSLYNLQGGAHRLLDGSRIAYVELLDQHNKPVLQARIALAEGKGDGSFQLPISLNTGTYKLRAYTNWMKNFGADCFFEKQLTIINSLKAGAAPATQATTYTAQFFPEGGRLVNNINSVLAFKVTDQYGKGASYTGWIVNEKNDTVATLNPLLFGMGQTRFTPDMSATYKAIIKTAGGGTHRYDLPAVQAQGHVLHAETSGDKLLITAAATTPAANVHLVVHTRRSVKYAASATLRNGTAQFVVPRPSLGDGISHITLFDHAGQPVCERLYFQQPAQQLSIEATTDKQAYGPRRQVSLAIAASDEQSRPSDADLTVAVVRIDSLSTADDASLLSYLWLSADLKGKIESPGYYFTHTGGQAMQAADNLMLTHGWRTFKTTAFTFPPELEGHIVKGRVVNNATGAPAANVPVSLAIPGSSSQFSIAESNANGEITFMLPGYYGSGELIAQAWGTNGNAYRIEISDPFAQEFSPAATAAPQLPQRLQQPILAHSVSMQVQQAYFPEKLARFASPAVDTTPFYGKPDNAYLLDDFTRFITMEEVLGEYVTEVVMIKRNGEPYPHIQKNVEGYLPGDPLVLVDGVPVANRKIAAFNPLKVKKLEVVANKYVVGPVGFDGVINFITYNGNMDGIALDPGAVVMDYEGLQLKREFYSPDYDNGQEASTLPDFRTVLLWHPGMKAAGGKAALSFFTSDLNGRYAAIIEGLDASGRAGRQMTLFEVADHQ